MGDEIYAGASLANDLALSQALEGMSRAPGMAIQQGLAIRDQQLREEQAREAEMRMRRQEQRLTMDRLADASLASSGPEMAPYGGGGGAPAAGRGATSAKAMQVQQAQAQAQQRPLWDYALGEQADHQQFLDVQAALADYDQQMAADAQTPYVGGPGPEEMMAAGGAMPQAPAQDDIFAGGLDDYITQGAGAPEANQVWRKPMGSAAFEARAPGGTTISDPGYDVNPMAELGESAAKAMDPGLVEKYLMSQARPNAQFNAMNPADKQDFMRRYEDWWRRTQQTRRGDEVDAARMASEGASLQRSNLGKALEAIARGNPEAAPVAESIGALAEILGDDEAALKALGQFTDTYQSKVSAGPGHRKAAVAEGEFAREGDLLADKKRGAYDNDYRKEYAASLAGDQEALDRWVTLGRPTIPGDLAEMSEGERVAHQRASAAGSTAFDSIGRLADKTGATASSGSKGMTEYQAANIAQSKARHDLNLRKEDRQGFAAQLTAITGTLRGLEYPKTIEEENYKAALLEESTKVRASIAALDSKAGASSFDEADFAAQFEAAKGRAPSDAELAAARAKVTGG